MGEGSCCFTVNTSGGGREGGGGCLRVVTSIDVSNHLSCNHQLYKSHVPPRCEYLRRQHARAETSPREMVAVLGISMCPMAAKQEERCL